jgi:hypothetical protein
VIGRLGDVLQSRFRACRLPDHFVEDGRSTAFDPFAETRRALTAAQSNATRRRPRCQMRPTTVHQRGIP